MKNIWIILLIVFFVALVGAGYFGLPILIKKETTDLRADVHDLKQRLQKIEEESKVALLQPDADAQKIIKTVNSIASRVNALEDSLKKDLSVTNEAIKKQGKATEEALNKQAEAIKNQKAATEEAFKKQTEAIEKIAKETETKIQRSMFNALMASIRGHVLKVKVDLVEKNIGRAKNELSLIDEAFEKAKTSASDENKKVIEELQINLKKARAEIDFDLPSAINRVDLLWHEMSKLLRKA